MINPYYYDDIYLFVVFIFLLIMYIKKWNNLMGEKEDLIISILFVVLLSMFIGFRPIHVAFADTLTYYDDYNFMLNKSFEINWNFGAFIFYALLALFASNNIDISLFFFIIAIMYFGGELVGIRKIFKKNYLIGFILFLSAFSTYSYSVNGIRSGVAASIFLCAIAFRKNKIISCLLLMISWGFHHSMHVNIISFIILSFYNKKQNVFFIIWLFSLCCAILHITYFQFLFANLTDNIGAKYLLNENAFMSSNLSKFGFVIYSAVPIIIRMYFIYCKKIYNEEYNFISNIYIILNSVWLLSMHSGYTNRIAYLSWQLYPIVLGYPYIISLDSSINDVKIKNISYVVWTHFMFSIFLVYVYYGFIR